jgi:hypothetical protein
VADCTTAPSAIPEALGLKTFTMDGTRWVVSVQTNDALGYRPGVLTRRVLTEKQFVRGRDYRTLRGQRAAKVAKAFGFPPGTHVLLVVAEDVLGRIVASRTGDHGEYARGLVVASTQRVVSPNSTPVDRLGLGWAVFEGKDVAKLTLAGQDCWIALEVARALEYGSDGRTLLTMIMDPAKWGGEFAAGVHYVVAKGEILKGIKDILNASTAGGSVDSEDVTTHSGRVSMRVNALTLLTRAGLWLVLDKTEKPVGVRFRQWLSGEVRQAAEEGRAVTTGMNGEALALPAPAETQLSLFGETQADVAREQRLLVREDHRHQEAEATHAIALRNADAEAARIRTGFAREVVGWDLTDPLKRGIVRATAVSIGLELSAGEA